MGGSVSNRRLIWPRTALSCPRASTPRLHGAAESLFKYEATRNYFFSEEGVPIFPGTKLKNPAYAETLKAIAADGAKAFYSGEIAQDIVNVIQSAEGNPGLLVAGRSGGLRSERAPCSLCRLSRYPGLRHGTTLIRRADGRPDIWACLNPMIWPRSGRVTLKAGG